MFLFYGTDSMFRLLSMSRLNCRNRREDRFAGKLGFPARSAAYGARTPAGLRLLSLDAT
jgi:hypothetical protein